MLAEKRYSIGIILKRFSRVFFHLLGLPLVKNVLLNKYMNSNEILQHEKPYNWKYFWVELLPSGVAAPKRWRNIQYHKKSKNIFSAFHENRELDQIFAFVNISKENAMRCAVHGVNIFTHTYKQLFIVHKHIYTYLCVSNYIHTFI